MLLDVRTRATLVTHVGAINSDIQVLLTEHSAHDKAITEKSALIVMKSIPKVVVIYTSSRICV